MALTDFTLSNARRFYSSMGNPSGWKGLIVFALYEKLFLLQFKKFSQAMIVTFHFPFCC